MERAATRIAELAVGLSRLVLLVRRKVTGAQHVTGPPLHRRQDLVELALQSATLRRPIAQEDPRLVGMAGRMTHGDVDGGQIIGDLGPGGRKR